MVNRKLYYNIKKIDLAKVIYKKIVKIYKSKKLSTLIRIFIKFETLKISKC